MIITFACSPWSLAAIFYIATLVTHCLNPDHHGHWLLALLDAMVTDHFNVVAMVTDLSSHGCHEHWSLSHSCHGYWSLFTWLPWSLMALSHGCHFHIIITTGNLHIINISMWQHHKPYKVKRWAKLLSTQIFALVQLEREYNLYQMQQYVHQIEVIEVLDC